MPKPPRPRGRFVKDAAGRSPGSQMAARRGPPREFPSPSPSRVKSGHESPFFLFTVAGPRRLFTVFPVISSRKPVALGYSQVGLFHVDPGLSIAIAQGLSMLLAKGKITAPAVDMSTLGYSASPLIRILHDTSVSMAFLIKAALLSLMSHYWDRHYENLSRQRRASGKALSYP